MSKEQCELKTDIQEILKNMKEWSVDGNLYFEINDEKAKLLYKYICDLQKQLQQKENIIKKIRDTMEIDLAFYKELVETPYYVGRKEVSQKVLNILDKENK